MQLASPEFAEQQELPRRFTCDGADISPPLTWADVPEEAVELAITCEDPDAPGGTFTHWTMWGIDPHAGGLPEGSVPMGAHMGTNDFGSLGYGGACPPRRRGMHHYRFSLHALREPLDANDGAPPGQVRRALRSATLVEAELVGTYER